MQILIEKAGNMKQIEIVLILIDLWFSQVLDPSLRYAIIVP
jgi:hypothetical protein